MSLRVAEQYYRAQERQEEATALLAAAEWRRMGASDIDASWARIIDRLALVTAAGQLGAARAGAAYVTLSLAAEAESDPRPQAWAGVASDGRGLDTLLYGAVVRTKSLLGVGAPTVSALAGGGAWLDMTVRTQVEDASRGAAGVAIAARPEVGYVRLVSATCCQRCAVLAGKHFKWNEGFLRHPRCKCRHVPAKAGEFPDGYSGDVSPDRIRDLTIAQRQAIADGADVNQVINAHRRGARSKDGMTTSEGATRRGLAGQRGARSRLTPEGIYRVSSSRDEALNRLRDNGYLL